MASPEAIRYWTVYKAAGRPMPRWSDDDVIDFRVTEAILYAANAQDEEDQVKQEQRNWRDQPVGSGTPKQG